MKATMLMFVISVDMCLLPCIAHASSSESSCVMSSLQYDASAQRGIASQGRGHPGRPCTEVPGVRLSEATGKAVPAGAEPASHAALTEGPAGSLADEAMGGAASESNTSTSDHQLEEVVVTAQRRTQQAFNVPISLVVLGGQELQERRIDNVTDLQFAVPGLYVESNGAQRRIQLNGISNGVGNGSFVSEYMDEADITPQGFAGTFGYGQFDTQTYDLQRVEVLRGPQGTLYGVGAMGGTIRYITNKPDLNRSAMSDDVSLLFTQDGSPSQRIEAMINTPLVENTLGLRLAGVVGHDGGWIDEPAARLKNFNSENLTDVRGEGLWEPSARVKVNFTEIIHRSSSGLNMGESANGQFTPVFDLAVAPQGEENFNLSNLTATYDFNQAQLLSSTTYFHHIVLSRDYMGVDPFSNGSVLEADYPFYPVESKNISQELRLVRSGKGPWQWTVGAFYKHYEDAEDYSYYFGAPGPVASAALYSNIQGVLSKSSSVFVDSSYQLFERLTTGAGVRYFKDDESFAEAGFPNQQASFKSTDPRFYLQYRVTGDVNAYASAAKGFRSGGFNDYGRPPYDPEQVWTYELGVKARSDSNKLSADADVFLSNYSRYVVFGGPLEQQSEVLYLNAGSARIKGVESDVEWVPMDRWRLSVKGDYIDAKFVTVAAVGTGYSAGEELPFVSKYMVTGSGEYTYPWRGRPADIRIDYSQISPQEVQYQGFPLSKSNVIRMLNLRVDMQWNDSVRLGAFAQNLINDRGYLDANAIFAESPRPRPRTIGIDIGVQFQ